MNAIELPQLFTISWLKEQYGRRALTPSLVVAEIIRRADKDRDMNIWITPPDLELIQPYLDRLVNMDPATAPLWGIPFAIKDNIDLAGVPTTAGCEEYAYVPVEDATVVKRLIEAGAVPIGKTNLDQFATGLVGTRSPYGETHNALQPELISGGSSSGSAVAVARGQAAFALGTDTAGSGRVPAALNGLIGLKPSLGAWPVKGVVPACESLDCVTVFAGQLEDVQAVDQVVRGLDDRDPWSKEVPLEPVTTVQHPVTIYLPKQPLEFFGPFADSSRQAWEQTMQQLQELGTPVEYIDTKLFAEAAALLYEGPWVAERWAGLGAFIDSHPGSTFPVTEQILRTGADPAHHAANVFQAMHQLQAYKHQARRLLQGGVLIMPTAGGTWTREQVREEPVMTNRLMGLYTNHCNLLDLCALAVPAGEAEPGLPFGITMFALSGCEAVLVNLAGEFERLQSRPYTQVAVCGLHMRGFPLEAQMQSHGARFVREDLTAPSYKMVALKTQPPKPGLIRLAEGGEAVALEVWEMPVSRFGAFAAAIPAPLGIGKVKLQDGTEVPGFICEGYAEQDAVDITEFGGWRAYSLQRTGSI
ncbi:allophanate hydrolase [Paenibacillus sambharensis]|uniref:Allophanate hydrolase n=1 Tax=Paenibacillus sambharensis TaxID=1803190 RepID=A0A2W1LGG0_9BACL|nr:allophanate hydrolase [Paenibacillus sambharensis]PZD97150.1 allophanate hydrolase [Paenibacillus sambharensis]